MNEVIEMQSNVLYNLIMVTVVLAIILISFLVYSSRKRNLQKEIPIKDERITRIVEKSATLSFYIGLFSMSFLMIMLIVGYEIFKITEFGALNVLELEILIMVLSFLSIYSYYSKYGTV